MCQKIGGKYCRCPVNVQDIYPECMQSYHQQSGVVDGGVAGKVRKAYNALVLAVFVFLLKFR
jgi:hypothetical protein